MPAFFKDLSLRRRSKSLKPSTDSGPSSEESSNVGDGLEQTQARNKSTSTLSSWFELRSSPPTTLSSQRTNKSATDLLAVNGFSNGNGNGARPVPSRNSSRPRLQSAQSNRLSMLSMPTQNGEAPPRTPSTSSFAPRVVSISDGSWVHQKVLLIFGQCADPQYPIDGSITVFHHGDTFPSTQWPVCDCHFKALVHLQPGPNRLRLDFVSPKLSSPSGQLQPHSSWININFLPLISAPPLQLCILVAKDSPETYDAVPERVQKEGNNLATAIRKFRMAAYLWQAFTAEQMNRNGFGRRCYRYEEEWQAGTLTWRDLETGQMRNEAKIHIVRMDKTVEEIRDLDVAQQYKPAEKKGELFAMAKEAVHSYFGPRAPGQLQYVSCMFLDTHWDQKVGTIRGHAALGGGDNSIKLAIFGSHCLQSYPAHIEEVVPAFSDCTRTDTNFVANDCNEAGSNWEAANIGIGAHLHETGHLLGAPHQESGIMKRDYVRLNRTFTCREPYSTRTKQQGQRLCLPQDECSWHRLDALRFRFHPCFQRPNDPSLNVDSSIQVWGVENGSILIAAVTGVAWIELYPEGDTECHHWIEYFEESSSPAGCPKQVTLTEKDLMDNLPQAKRKKKLRLQVYSCGGAEHKIEDFSKFGDKTGTVKLPDGRCGFKSARLGFSNMEGTEPAELYIGGNDKVSKMLLSIRVYHGKALLGLEFFYEEGYSELFGTRAGNRRRSDFFLDRMKAETVIGFYVRAGVWIDAIQILTSTGRRSEVFGHATGGSGHTLIPPRGYSIAGIYGSHAAWVDGFGLIITR